MSLNPPHLNEPSGALFSPLLEAAVSLAARGHYHQFRKQSANEQNAGNSSQPFLPSRVPYVAHLMGTMCILARLGARDEVLAAAILRDYLEAVLIKGADVLHNLLSLLADLSATDDPETVWQRFNAGSTKQLWYFTSVVDAVENRLGDHPLVIDLQRALGFLKAIVSG